MKKKVTNRGLPKYASGGILGEDIFANLGIDPGIDPSKSKVKPLDAQGVKTLNKDKSFAGLEVTPEFGKSGYFITEEEQAKLDVAKKQALLDKIYDPSKHGVFDITKERNRYTHNEQGETQGVIVGDSYKMWKNDPTSFTGKKQPVEGTDYTYYSPKQYKQFQTTDTYKQKYPEEFTPQYALGSSGIENPATTIAKNNIMIAQAEQDAQSNPWIPITMMAGQLAASSLGSLISSAGTTQSVDPNALPKQAMGNSGIGGNAEVEGQEVLELPTGQVAEVKGASHENGGVDMNLPQGTKIYSKRIEKFGETMAERKKIRERKKLNLDKLLESGKSDIAIKNAHQRTMETLEEQEAEDLRTQEMFGMMAAIQEFAYGTNKDGTPKYAIGTGGEGTLDDDELTKQLAAQYQDEKNNLPGTVFSRTTEAIAPHVSVPGVGDLTSIAGDLISTFGPERNTLANRAADTPNVNAYKDFGKDALEANLAAMELSTSQKDSTLRRIGVGAAGAKRAGRNTARGVNQLRALDLASDINVNEASQSATDSFTRTMQELLGQKSGLENVQDQAVMQGEAARDLADRQDQDNFYTQMGRDIATKGQGVQQIGKDLNAIKSNKMMDNVINQLSKYGLAFDDKGNLIQKPQTK